MPEDWFLATTKPAQENRAATNLARQGQNYYLPQFFNRRRRLRQPLFPGYIFVCVRRGAPFSFIHSTYGISKLMMTSGTRPATVPHRVITDLRSAENKHGVIQLRGDDLVEGAAVDVLDGVFRGIRAIYVGSPAPHRVAVLLNILGHSTRVTLDAGDVRRVA